MEELKETLKCSICFDKNATQIAVPCGHTFCCIDCCESLKKSSTNILKCCVCRSEIDIFVINYSLKSVCESVEKLSYVPESHPSQESDSSDTTYPSKPMSSMYFYSSLEYPDKYESKHNKKYKSPSSIDDTIELTFQYIDIVNNLLEGDRRTEKDFQNLFFENKFLFKDFRKKGPEEFKKIVINHILAEINMVKWSIDNKHNIEKKRKYYMLLTILEGFLEQINK
jgi:hypothetical protein